MKVFMLGLLSVQLCVGMSNMSELDRIKQYLQQRSEEKNNYTQKDKKTNVPSYQKKKVKKHEKK